MRSKTPIAIKVYLVFQRVNLHPEGEPNRKVIAAKLTRAAAQAIVDASPGTYIEKMIAVK